MNKTTLVFPLSEKTFTIPSIVKRIPLKRFQSPIINHPKNIPVRSDINTCLVLIASIIAIRGGTKDMKP